MSVQLADIPYASYDVYIYYAGFSSNHSLTWVATDTATNSVLGTWYSVRGSLSGPQLFPSPGLVQSKHATLAEADARAALGDGGNWLKFTGLTAGGLRIAETSGNGGNENGFAGIQIVSTAAGGTTFGEWIAGFPGAAGASGFEDDADGDGIRNGLENHFGSDPTQPGVGLTLAGTSGSTFRFRHTRRRRPATDVVVTYQWSGDMVGWFTSGQTNPQGLTVSIASEVVPDSSVPDLDVVEVALQATAGSTGRLFARIRASLLP
jgi:hypothetical protein